VIIWIWLAITFYSLIALSSIFNFSYECHFTYGEYHFTFLSVLAGIFWPITLIIKLIGGAA